MYSNLLTEEARQPWTKVVEKQINSEPWIDLCGNDHPKKYAESWASFIKCATFHLKTVFRHDVVETETFYISNR